MQAPSREVACSLIALAIACSAPAGAADVIGADRAEVLEASTTVGQGHLQTETSLARLRPVDPRRNTMGLAAPALLPYALSDDPEVRWGTLGYARSTLRNHAMQIETQPPGAPDPASGVKMRVMEGDGMWPSVAVLVHGDIDPASRAVFKGEGVRPSLRSTLDWRPSHDFSVAATPGLVYDKTEGRRHASGVLDVALGKAWTPRFRTYVETAADRIASSRHGGSTVTYNLGGAYLLGDAMQIDSALSWGRSSDMAVLGWAIGFWMQF